MFDESKCDLCGDCLVECQYVDYDRDKAVAQISALIEGKQADILRECVTCVACNEYCPQDANPFDLICELQEETSALPVPDGMRKMFDGITAMPSSIVQGEPGKPVMSLCVMGPMVPDTFKGRMFDGMTFLQGSDYFCQIGYVHLGMESPMRDGAQTFVDNIAKTGAKEVIFMHDDCYAALTVKAPEYGVTVPFRPIHIFEYLRDYLREHKGDIKKLNMKVAYQRPCASRYTPAKDAMLDEIFELVGVERPQRQYDRLKSLCCGGVVMAFNPAKGVETQQMNLSDSLQAGAEAMVYLCPMCVRTLINPAEEKGLKSYIISDLCRLALGEAPASA